jgi:hypothetical protein
VKLGSSADERAGGVVLEDAVLLVVVELVARREVLVEGGLLVLGLF